MKVLFVNNIASMHAITASHMNSLPNVEARCLVFNENKYRSDSDVSIYEPLVRDRRTLFHHLVSRVYSSFRVLQWLRWADIVHYTWRPVFQNGADLIWCRLTKKPVLIEWVGSEVRDHSTLRKLNPYFDALLNIEPGFKEPHYKKTIQRKFSWAKALPTVCPEMSLYIDQDLFPRKFQLMQRIDVENFPRSYPSLDKTKPLIVHASTSSLHKGTAAILDIIEELRRDFDFDFELITNRNREEALAAIKDCDIYIDQMILGSYGVACLEAMSFGKPVLSYIMEEVFEQGLPRTCPIVNTSLLTLGKNLIELVDDAVERNRIGRACRAYVESYHDVGLIADDLLRLYKSQLDNSPA